MIGHFFKDILVYPILNLLVLCYRLIPDIGVVIILLTLLIRLILLPSFHKSMKSQAKMSALQPKLNDLRDKHKNDQQALARETMALYREHGVNPFSSCLPLLIQLPLLIALYQVFLIALKVDASGHTMDLGQYLYPFVHNPGPLNKYFLHIIDLARPSIVLGVIAGAAQFIQSKMMLPKQKSNDPTANAISQQTLFLLPVLTVIFSLRLPAGLPLYWLVTTLFAIGQQYYIMRTNP